MTDTEPVLGAGHTIDDIIGWVGTDAARIESARAAETARGDAARPKLLEQLRAVEQPVEPVPLEAIDRPETVGPHRLYVEPLSPAAEQTVESVGPHRLDVDS